MDLNQPCRLRSSIEPSRAELPTRKDGLAIPRVSIMTLARRAFLRVAAGAVALPALPHIAQAGAYPNRPVRIVVGTAPGGAADIFARLIGDWLSKRLGQPVIVENSAGGGGVVAAEMVLHSPADGYTLFLAISSASIVSGPLRDGLIFVRDSAPIAMLVQEPIILWCRCARPPGGRQNKACPYGERPCRRPGSAPGWTLWARSSPWSRLRG